MAIAASINKRMEFSQDLTKQKTRDLDDFFFRAFQFIRLEAADVELALMAQTMTDLQPQSNAEAKSNNGGKRKVEAGATTMERIISRSALRVE